MDKNKQGINFLAPHFEMLLWCLFTIPFSMRIKTNELNPMHCLKVTNLCISAGLHLLLLVYIAGKAND